MDRNACEKEKRKHSFTETGLSYAQLQALFSLLEMDIRFWKITSIEQKFLFGCCYFCFIFPILLFDGVSI